MPDSMDLKKLNVIVIDDDEFILEQTRVIFDQLGIHKVGSVQQIS